MSESFIENLENQEERPNIFPKREIRTRRLLPGNASKQIHQGHLAKKRGGVAPENTTMGQNIPG